MANNSLENELAINGGESVRKSPLPKPYLGTSVYGKEELELLTEVVQKKVPFREYGDGTPHMVKDFEAEARKYFGVPYSLATATGSGSFYCAMAGLGVGPGDEVIIPSFGWYTDYCAPVILGATPIFADIDRSLCMDPADFEQKITPRTKVVIVVHFQGSCNDMAELLEIAKSHNIKVVEDCAQACGGTYKSKKLGSLGDVACFSFQQNKIISTGDGGLLIAKDPSVFERAVRFHDLGMIRPSLASQMPHQPALPHFASLQFRMNEFTGAVALAQLRKLDSAIIGVTQKHFRNLKKTIAENCPDIKFRQTVDEEGDCGIALYMDMLNDECGKWFHAALEAEQIRVGPSSGCCNLLNTELVRGRHLVNPALPPFGPGWAGEKIEYSPDQCPNTDRIINRMQCIALSPGLTDNDISDIGKAIIKVWRNRPKQIFVSQ